MTFDIDQHQLNQLNKYLRQFDEVDNPDIGKLEHTYKYVSSIIEEFEDMSFNELIQEELITVEEYNDYLAYETV